MTRTKIQEVKNHNSSQYRTTLPKQLVEALKGKRHDLLEWTVMDGKMVAEVIRK